VDNITVIGFEKEDAHLSAKLELAAERRGRPIPRMDALIAAIAMNKKATLYTFNKQHFETLKKDGLMLLE